MKAFNFFRLCRSSTVVTMPVAIPHPPKIVDVFSDDGDEDEFEDCFDLDITSFDVHNKENTNVNTYVQNSNEKSSKIQQPKRVSSDKRKITPIDSSSRPQSPIALLKSAPSFWFKKTAKSGDIQKRDNTKERKSLSVEFKLEDESKVSRFSRENSFKVKQKAEENSSFMQKYLNKLKSGNEKMVVKKNLEKIKVSRSTSLVSSAASTPRKGKSPKAPASSPVMVKRFDSIMEMQDGIQGAILHCKRSFNSSPDS